VVMVGQQGRGGGGMVAHVPPGHHVMVTFMWLRDRVGTPAEG
jgi:hypothetical protein